MRTTRRLQLAITASIVAISSFLLIGGRSASNLDPANHDQVSATSTANLLDLQFISPTVSQLNSDWFKPRAEFPFKVRPNSTLSEELQRLSFNQRDINAIIQAAKPHYNLNRIRAGIPYRLIPSPNSIVEAKGIEFAFSPTEFLKVERLQNSEWSANLTKKTITTEVAHFYGFVESSLWESAKRAEMDSSLIAQLTEVFAWQIDFAREVRVADSWRISVEQNFVDGEPIGWGKILAAEYLNQNRKFEAVYYENNSGVRGYFTPNGDSVEKMFLRSPIEFARISSGFSMKRFHPVLKVHRPHLGVDYAAKTGTPVRSIGEGRIAEARYNHAGGNTIVISHNSVYTTRYLHLHNFARGITPGTRVQQGQVIGYVGATGLATGPHLHFEFYERGRYKDPLRVDLPSAEAVPQKYLAQFREHAKIQISGLPNLPQAVASDSAIIQEAN